MHEDRKQAPKRPPDLRTFVILGIECAGLLVAAVLVGFIVGGCGEQPGHRVAGNGSAPSQSVEAAGAVVAMTPSPSQVPASEEGVDVASPDSLPPDVSASATDSLVVPGAVVEITAQSSVDATLLTLWDGLGKRQSFVYDEAGKLWRTYYRVPLKGSERVGLSVTAWNERGRWRRVWVFLNVDRGGRGAVPVAPTTE